MANEHRMEQLSRAYVQAVAAVAGCTWSIPEPDYGIDLTLRRVARRGKRYMPVGRAVDLQLKSTTTALLEPDHIGFDLDVRAHDILRRSTRTAPAFLVLHTIPPDPLTWLDQTEDRLQVRGCVYWVSLRGEPPTTNAATIRVRLPRLNIFTTAALERIMDAVSRGEDPS